ncbi:MAG TPA: isopentenyl transferase family protein, partial [Sphingobacterium bovisgrunnientis]|nr:isopentenyl transferase family protein [Sphingobacterium bovisgrunnientis]
MINTSKIIKDLQEDAQLHPEDLLIILGPTASGKTKLAVEIAKHINAEIISADSRQVYRHMDIGTGKDLAEYQNISYHLINILEPGERYNIDLFLKDFEDSIYDIIQRGKRVIVCGGTGFYIQSLLHAKPYTQIPVDLQLRSELESLNKEEIQILL